MKWAFLIIVSACVGFYIPHTFLCSSTNTSVIPSLVESPIIIDHSNVTLKNRSFILGDQANCPVIIIGNVFGEPITNIVLENISIDGNRLHQTLEVWKTHARGVIMANGCVIQNASNVRLTNVFITSCRSGGLVTTLNSSKIQVDHLTCMDNKFDGMACYSTVDSVFRHVKLTKNLCAGLSIDSSFDSNVILDSEISSNSTGIFMRHSSFNTFFGIAFRSNSGQDVFMAQVDRNKNSGCVSNVFIHCATSKFQIANPGSCIGNSVEN